MIQIKYDKFSSHFMSLVLLFNNLAFVETYKNWLKSSWKVFQDLVAHVKKVKPQTNEILVMEKHQVTLEYNVDNEARASTSVVGQKSDPSTL